MTRFFAPSVSWNKTAAELGEAVGMDDYVRRFMQNAWGREPSARRKFQPKIGDYSVVRFKKSDATMKVRVAQTTYGQSIRSGLGNVPVGVEIPWNPDWAKQLPGGSDRCAVIVDEDTGETWELWQTCAPHAECVDWIRLFGSDVLKRFGGPNGRAGFVPGSPGWIGAGSCFRTANIFTATTTVDGRGMGINKSALTVWLDELEQGHIDHALAGVFCNPMSGPAAVPASTNLDPEAGKTRVFFLAPGRKAEYLAPRVPSAANTWPITEGLPTGIRYAFRITDARIEQWLNAVHGDGPLRSLAHIVAVAMRDYGWIYAETGEWAVGVEFQAATTPEAAERYRKLGVHLGSVVSGTPLANIMDGIWDYGTVYVVRAAA